MSDTSLSFKKPSELSLEERKYFKKTLLESSNFIFKLSYLLNKMEYFSDLDSEIALFYKNNILTGMIVFKKKKKFNKYESLFKSFNVIDIDFLKSEKGNGSLNLKLFLNHFKESKIILYTEKDFQHLDSFYRKNGFEKFAESIFPRRKYYSSSNSS